MQIKVIKSNAKKASGLDAAEVSASGETNGHIAVVQAHVKFVDCYQVGHVIGSLRMSPEEARGLAGRLIAAASEAERLLQAEAVRR